MPENARHGDSGRACLSGGKLAEPGSRYRKNDFHLGFL